MLSVQLNLTSDAEAKLTLMEMTGVNIRFQLGSQDTLELHVGGRMNGELVDRCYFTNKDPSVCIEEAFEYYLGVKELHGKS
jgi:hypothetical protein